MEGGPYAHQFLNRKKLYSVRIVTVSEVIHLQNEQIKVTKKKFVSPYLSLSFSMMFFCSFILKNICDAEKHGHSKKSKVLRNSLH